MTERDMLDLLLGRYTTERRGTIADRYVRAEHVLSSQGQYGISIADFVAIDKYSTTQALIGHEVKVSRADWLSEIRDLSKAERVKKFCIHWYLVIPDAAIVKAGELPEGWGLMIAGKSGLRVRIKAPVLVPEPLTLDFVAGLAAAVQRTATREPLHRDASTILQWHDSTRTVKSLCQGCGGPAPCALHQPRTVELILRATA